MLASAIDSRGRVTMIGTLEDRVLTLGRRECQTGAAPPER
jgi:hypothetical protein